MGFFIGRERELALLNDTYSSGESAAFAMFGRRRIGKTYLLEHFCEGKRSLFIRALKGNMRANLDYISGMIGEHTGSEPHHYTSYGDVMKDLESICRTEKTVIIIDEFPYLLEGCDVVSSYLQHFIDSVIVHSDSMLILCGSSLRTMERECEDENSPLFGRFKRIIRMKPLTFDECRGFHNDMDELDQLKLYLTIGGIPKYHREMNQPTYKDCIMENYMDDGWMINEAEYLLSSEFNSSGNYMEIIRSISEGAVRQKEIVEKTGTDKGGCSKSISNLERMGIVEKINPMMGAPKSPVYQISDNLLAFNEEVVRKRRHLLSSNNLPKGYDSLEPFINTFLGKRFELFCRDYMVSNYNVLEIGKWWMDTRDEHMDIDLVARLASGQNRADVYAECKFRKRRTGFSEYNLLESRVSGLDRGNPRMVMFSVSGFEGDLVEFASETGLVLIGPEELFGHRAPPAIV